LDKIFDDVRGRYVRNDNRQDEKEKEKIKGIFFKSFKNVEEEIVIIVNKESVITLNAKPNYWTIKPLGVFDEINHVRVDNSQKVIYDKTFDNEFREVFKNKSYIISE
jgi:hypothetical protein